MSLRPGRLDVLALLALLILAARAELAHEQRALRVVLGQEVPRSARVALPSGYFASGLNGAGLGGRGCLIIRYVSRGCIYCADSKQAWDSLAGTLGRLGCLPVGVVPRAALSLAPSVFGVAGESQLAWLTMDWVEGWRPTETPTTLVVDGAGRVLWSRVGELRPDDAAAAAAAVRRRLGRS